MANRVALSPALVARIGAHIAETMRRTPGIDSAALCTLNGQCLWASDAAFSQAAPHIARIGLMSVRLWAKVRSGKLDRIGLVTQDGTVDLIFVPPIASVLVASGHDATSGWLENEPEAMLEALGISATSVFTGN